MRHFAFIPCLASSLVTNLPVESLQSLNSAGASTRVQKLRSAPGASVDEPSNRRSALLSIFGGAAATFMAPVGARALDMDAFVNSQLDQDTKNCDPKKDRKCIPPLTSDQALCKYGQSGNARGEACARVKAAGGSLAKPGSEGKSPGGAYAM